MLEKIKDDGYYISPKGQKRRNPFTCASVVMNFPQGTGMSSQVTQNPVDVYYIVKNTVSPATQT